MSSSELTFNDLLLSFFLQTNNLYIEENELLYQTENIELSKEKVTIYHKWLQIFSEISLKLGMDEIEILNVYNHKNEKNQKRVIKGS